MVISLKFIKGVIIIQHIIVCYISNASAMLHKGGDDTEYTLKSVDVILYFRRFDNHFM